MKNIVVIGAGLGGLASGIRLLQLGHKVTLFEKEAQTGGYSINYKRQTFIFDLALHVIPSGDKGQEFHRLLEKLGVASNIDFIRLRQGFEVILGDFKFLMPNDFKKLQDKLIGFFPKESQQIHLFFKDVQKYGEIYGPLFRYGYPKHRSIPPFLLRIPTFLKHSNLPVEGYFSKFFNNEKLKAILFQPAAFMGIDTTRFPTINYIMMFYLLMKDGMYTIRGGGQKLTDALTKQFLSLGGTLHHRSEISKILINKKRATGVSQADGTTVSCDAIICGNNLLDTVHSLIGQANFSKEYIDNLASLDPSVSVLALNLGLSCSPKALGIDNHIAMIFPDANIDTCFKNQVNSLIPLGFSVTAQSNSDSNHYRNCGHTLSIIGGTAASKWFQMDRQEYVQTKKDVTENILLTISSYFPKLKDHVITTDLATPCSMKRYTANPQGAIMGFNCTTGSHRHLIKATKVPFDNIVVGSAWTNRLGGFMQSIKSGILAAEQIR